MARTPNRRPADDDDDEDEKPAPKRRPARDEEEDDEEDRKPVAKKRPVRDDDEDDEKPVAKKRKPTRDEDEEDEDEDDDKPAKKKKKGGALLYVFLGCGGLLFVGVVAIIGGLWYVGNKANKALSQMTITTSSSSSPDSKVKTSPVSVKALELKGHEGAVHGLAFSKDGNSIASVSQDKTLRIWDVGSGTEKKSIELTAGYGFGVGWTAEGYVVTSAGNGKDKGGEITWWDAQSGVNRKKISPTVGLVRGLAVSPDGQKLFYAKGNEIEVIGSGIEDTKPAIFNTKTAVYDTKYAAFSPDGKAVAFYSGFGPQVLTLAGTPKVKKMDYDPQDGTGIAIDNKGTVFVTTTRTVVSAIDSQTGQLIKNISDLNSDTWGACVSPDGKYIAAGVGNTVRLYDPKTRAELGRFTAETPETLSINSLAFSADSSKIAAGGGTAWVTGAGKNAKNYTIFVWNTAEMTKP